MQIDEEISIEIGFENLDYMGLPRYLTIKLDNFDINLWDGDYYIFIDNVLSLKSDK